MRKQPVFHDFRHTRNRISGRASYYRRKKQSTEERQLARYPQMNRELRTARLARGWTKRQVASSIAISASAYWNYENLSAMPCGQALCNLCTLFALSPQELGYSPLSRR